MFWEVTAEIAGAVFSGALLIYVLMPGVKYIRTHKGVKEEFDSPPPPSLDN